MSGLHLAIDWTRGDFHLKVELDLPGHGITALFRQSGSGRTALLRLIAGLERALTLKPEVLLPDEPRPRWTNVGARKSHAIRSPARRAGNSADLRHAFDRCSDAAG